ncbi:HNH endonuclease [Streptomyces sp. NPDC048604]|uniref:HNH endonuclease n=1 Tax=Streptomyces sp. NPDC048604 TaxID=3365578 RepID=UPI0037133E12
MAVSKRLRYEILRRDNHTCRYCGATAPGVPLRVDHVVPKALGGTDTPDNLVTSCEPCNSGKSSVPPDAATVADVARDTVRWSVAWKQAAEEERLSSATRAARTAEVMEVFTRSVTARYGVAPHLPQDAEASVVRWLELGLPQEKIVELIAYTVGRTAVAPDNKWRYLAGCCWSALKGIEQRTRAILLNQGEATEPEGEDDLDEDDEIHVAAAVALSRTWSPGVGGFRELYLAVQTAIFECYSVDDIVGAATWGGVLQEPDITVFLSARDDYKLTEAEQAAAGTILLTWRSARKAADLDEVESGRLAQSTFAALSRGFSIDDVVAATALAGRFNDPNITHYLPRWSPRVEHALKSLES